MSCLERFNRLNVKRFNRLTVCNFLVIDCGFARHIF